MENWSRLKTELQKVFKGDIATDEETLEKYSRDASIFKVMPAMVVFPKSAEDIEHIVRFVNEKKSEFPELSLTARSAGTDMTGGPLGESIIVECARYLNRLKEIGEDFAVVEPGMYYRDFEKETLARGLIFPSYPASKSICAIGGMVANNAGGEDNPRFGKTNKHVRRLRVVLSDGKEYEFLKLTRETLEEKKKQNDFEGEIYRKTHDLLEKNFDIIQGAKPRVLKNSAGYALWDVWDRKTFDLTQLFVGSQGTLGIITEANLHLVREDRFSKLLVVFINDIRVLADVVNTVLPYKPESLEAFDSQTLKLAMRFLPDIAKKLGRRGFLSLAASFMGEALMALRHGLPKFVMLVQIEGDDEGDIDKRMKALYGKLSDLHVPSKIMKTEMDSEKYWIMRRESFNLLRHRVKGKKAAPFIDDVIVAPEKLPEFLPRLYVLLRKHGITPTLAGHAASGNFHIIPLMDLKKEEERKKIPVVSEKVYDLVLEYGGSITAEHNDGIIRTPYLEKMYGPEITAIFRRVKELFDPKGIFNPGKKVGGTVEYAMTHMIRE